MTEPPLSDEFFRDLAECETVRIALRAQVRVEWDKHPAVSVHRPISPVQLDGVDAAIVGVPVSGEVDTVWKASGKFGEGGRFEVEKVEKIGREAKAYLVSRTSRRIDSPTCDVAIRVGRLPTAIEGRCLDLSAGGIGMVADASLELGEPVTVTIEAEEQTLEIPGFVAHAGGGRVGVRFAPLARTDAQPLYTLLNGLAGEEIVSLIPTRDSTPDFYEALDSAEDVRVVMECAGEIDGSSIVVRNPAGEDGLLSTLRTLEVEVADGIWHAEVASATADRVRFANVASMGDPRATPRVAGFRVPLPASAGVEVTRQTDSSTFVATGRDLSRGGIGIAWTDAGALTRNELLDLELRLRDGTVKSYRGRAVYARREEEEMFAGIEFVGLSGAAREDLNNLVTRLENRMLLSRALYLGCGILALVVLLVVFAQWVVPERPRGAAADPPAVSGD